tara:strand:- start:356 stop:736 length:381 start_codon:yes stop_codon:yes gene_type:complete
MNWERIKNDFTHAKPSSYYEITGSEYFSRWVYVRGLGWLDETLRKKSISQLGYETYLTILTVMGKDSIWGSPKRTQKLTTQIDKLLELELLVFDTKERKFVFGNGMPGVFMVLTKAMNGKSVPKIS